MAQIYVRKLYADQGKFGMEYKIQATDGNYYTSKTPFPDFVEEGAALEVEAQAGKNPKYLKLKGIQLIPSPAQPYQAPPAGTPNTSTNQTKAGDSAPIPTPATPALSPQLQAEWMAKAQEAMNLAFGNEWDLMVYAPIIAELVHHYYGEFVSQQMKARYNANKVIQ